MITFAEVKAAYPNASIVPPPVRRPPGPLNYCVGGAFCLAIGMPTEETYRFPDEQVLSDELERVLLLSEESATQASASIISLNDMGNFEGAWAVLGKCFEGVEK